MKNDLDNEVNKKTRNQYASPPRGNAIPAGPLSDFLAIFTSLGMERVSQVYSFTPNFTVVALKMWAYRRQNSQNC